MSGGQLFNTMWPPNTPTPDQFKWCADPADQLPPAPCIWSLANVFISARSYHRGGVNLGLADGAVRFVSNSVDRSVFQALGSRNGGELPREY